MIKEKIIENTPTNTVNSKPSLKLGQLTLFFSSPYDSLKYFKIPNMLFFLARVERLELPTPGFGDQCSTNWAKPVNINQGISLVKQNTLTLNIYGFYYSTISVTCPAPTVLPPSRIAKRNPTLIAIDSINSTIIVKLSPGITISTPDGNSIVPVTSVVLT